MQIAASEIKPKPSQHLKNSDGALDIELTEESLESLRGPVPRPVEISSGPSDTMAQTPSFTQDQKSATSNPIVTAQQSPENPGIDNTVTQSIKPILQLASSSNSLAVTVIPLRSDPVALYTSSSSIALTAVPDLSSNPMTLPFNSITQRTSSSSTPAAAATQIPNKALAQSATSIDDQTSPNNIVPISMPQLPSRTRAQATSSANHQFSSSSSNSPANALSRVAIFQSSSLINDQSISIDSILPIPASHLADIPSIHDTSSSSTLAPVVTQLSNDALSQFPSSINHQSSSSFNYDALLTQLQQLPFSTVIHNTSSVGNQSSPSSSFNSNPSHILPSDSMLTNHPPAQNLPTTTLAVIAGSVATQFTAPSAVTNALGLELTETGIVPPGASATPGEIANSAIGYGGDGIEIVQIFPTTTLIVSIVSSFPTAVISTVQGPVVTILASMGIIAPGTSAMQHGGVNGSSVVKGGGSVTGSDGAATGSGNPTETVPGRTNISTVFTGGTKGVNGWSSWLLGFGILVWEVGMLYWM